MNSTELKAPVVAALKQLLQPLGYRKSGSLFSRELPELVHLVQVQSSRYSTSSEVQLTVNLGIYIPSLIASDIRAFTKPSLIHAQWRQRLGHVSPENRDLWWSISNAQVGHAAATAIVSRLSEFGIPALGCLSDLQAVRALWGSGRGPGLTAFERQQFLSQLHHQLAA